MHRIQNFEALATNDLRLDALSIAEAGYAAITIGEALTRRLRVEGTTLSIDTKEYPLAARRVYFVGVGKCAFAAAEAIENILGERLTGGIALDVSPIENGSLTKIETYSGTHPLPSEVNVQATKRIVEFLSERSENDLVLMLISGGGSTLLCLHTAPMTCLDESALFQELTAKGATIQDINTVRKHISLARGGALAKAAYPAEVISLIISDVPGDAIGVIASGPTVLDTTTVADAQAILTRYGITASSAVEFIETTKEQKYFDRVTNTLFLSSKDALAAMQGEAEKRGYAASVVDDHFSGEARAVGRTVAEKLHTMPAKTVLLYAGESTVTVSGNAAPTLPVGAPTPGVGGGRNQELALAALEYLNPDEVFLPFSSDGRDNTKHAGAIADTDTLAHAKEKNLSSTEYLDTHHSYDFFATTNDALITGYTGSNVSDLIIALKK